MSSLPVPEISADPKLFTCSQCNKIFTRKKTLKEHSRSHTGERPERCRKCGKGFARKNDTRRHEKTCGSSAIALFPCTVCDKGFSRRSTLNKHQSIHSSAQHHIGNHAEVSMEPVVPDPARRMPPDQHESIFTVNATEWDVVGDGCRLIERQVDHSLHNATHTFEPVPFANLSQSTAFLRTTPTVVPRTVLSSRAFDQVAPAADANANAFSTCESCPTTEDAALELWNGFVGLATRIHLQFAEFGKGVDDLELMFRRDTLDQPTVYSHVGIYGATPYHCVSGCDVYLCTAISIIQHYDMEGEYMCTVLKRLLYTLRNRIIDFMLKLSSLQETSRSDWLDDDGPSRQLSPETLESNKEKALKEFKRRNDLAQAELLSFYSRPSQHQSEQQLESGLLGMSISAQRFVRKIINFRADEFDEDPRYQEIYDPDMDFEY